MALYVWNGIRCEPESTGRWTATPQSPTSSDFVFDLSNVCHLSAIQNKSILYTLPNQNGNSYGYVNPAIMMWIYCSYSTELQVKQKRSIEKKIQIQTQCHKLFVSYPYKLYVTKKQSFLILDLGRWKRHIVHY